MAKNNSNNGDNGTNGQTEYTEDGYKIINCKNDKKMYSKIPHSWDLGNWGRAKIQLQKFDINEEPKVILQLSNSLTVEQAKELIKKAEASGKNRIFYNNDIMINNVSVLLFQFTRVDGIINTLKENFNVKLD